MTSAEHKSLWSTAFILLCSAQFLGYSQSATLQPTLPLYVTHLGGSPFVVGVTIASFSITSLLFRPFTGYWADRWSESGVLALGLLLQGLSILLCFIPFTGVIMLANAIRGIGWAGMTAGGYALLAASAPPAQRGEAAGYYRGVQSGATIAFPAIALWIIDASFGGYRGAFLTAIAMALLGAGVAFALSHRTPPTPHSPPADSMASLLRDVINVFDRSILLPAALLFILSLSGPVLTGFFVIYAREIGIGHFGWYFVVTGVTSLLARPLLGRLSDEIGYGRSLMGAYTMETLGLLSLCLVTNLAWAMFAGVLYFIGSAIGGATVFALAMERAPAERRGRAMASFSVALPLGSGAGGLLCGTAVDLAGYMWMFVITAVLSALGLVLTGRCWSQLR